MINKIYKLIHNKFPRIFKFIFFIRYLFLLFFVSTVLFLFIPQFFNYENKAENIKFFLNKNYALNISQIGNINYKALPVPHLIIDTLDTNFFSQEIDFKVEKLLLFPKLINIYNYNNFLAEKIKFQNSSLEIEAENFRFFINKIFNTKKKFIFENLNLLIKENEKKIIDIKKINYSNHGYKKNRIIGEIFDKKFKIKLLDNSRDINFKLLDTGISISIENLEQYKNTSLKGNLKGKILKSNFKLDFIYDKNYLKIDNLFFRDKDLSFKSIGLIELKPFFKASLNSEIKEIDLIKLKKLEYGDFVKLKPFIKRLNIQNNIVFKSKKFSRNLIDNLKIESNIAYGRLNIIKMVLISNSELNCKSNINLIEEFPILYFNCSLISNDKKKLLKRFEINFKEKSKLLNLKVIGNLNVLNNKINFDLIEMNNNYKATDGDLKYFKEAFENIVFDENFLKIFDYSKFKEFILEIS